MTKWPFLWRLAARSPQRSPGRGWRNKVLADSADDPDADKADDLDETAYCKTTIFRPLAARSPQRPPGQA